MAYGVEKWHALLYTSSTYEKTSVWKFREGGEQRGVEGKRVVGRRVEGNGSPPPCLDVFKISKGEGGNQSFPLFGCFKNWDGEEGKLLKQTNSPLIENGLATLVYY